MTTENIRSVFAKIVPVFVIVAIVASAFGPSIAKADGVDGGYDGYIDNYGSGLDGGYDGYIDKGPDTGGYDGGYDGYIDSYPSSNSFDDCSYYRDCGAPTKIYDNYGGYDDCSYYRDCGTPTKIYDNYGGYSSQPYYGGSYYSSYQTPVYSYTTPSYNYSYDYDYSYDSYTYENNDHHSCQSGYSGTYPNCYPPQCPSGYTGSYPNCYPPQHNNPPVCDISADDTSIDDNDSTILHWTSENATSATLSGFGSVATGGSRSVSPNDDTTYTLHVTGQGGSDTCSTTVHVNQHQNNNLSCDLTASDRSISEGDDTRLRWTIDGDANYASINHGVGRVDEQSGSETVSPSGDTTYTLTVRDNDGDEDTCSVDINVDNNNFSSVTFTGEPTNNPPVVYLSSIPYTGLEDIDPTLLTYWALLIAAAGIAVWFAYQKGLIPQFAFSTAQPEEGETEEAVEEGHVEENSAVTSFLASLADGDTDAAIEEVRSAAAAGHGVEEFLADAAAATSDSALQSRIQNAYEASKLTGIRGAKAALA